MKKICIATATRAEYGLLKPLITRFQNRSDIELKIVVTGAHLSRAFGFTYKEIEADGFEIDAKIDMLLSSDSPSGITKSMGLALVGFADYFKENRPELLVLLGDRYESLSVAIAAMNERIPIAHLHGGETTEGAIDEGIRHAISKLSLLHFTSTELYKNRVIQLGESPERVFNVGALGVENVMKEELLSKKDLEISIDMVLSKPFAVITFHPVTLENSTSSAQMSELLQAVDAVDDMIYIFTKANADVNGRVINEMIDDFCHRRENAVAFTSLGLKRYLSALKYTEIVIGNSSSGIIEAPSFGIPTLNIGDRQKGRIQAESIVNCEATFEEIVKGIQEARTQTFKEKAKKCHNPYEKKDTSLKIEQSIISYLESDDTNLKKPFYDIPFDQG